MIDILFSTYTYLLVCLCVIIKKMNVLYQPGFTSYLDNESIHPPPDNIHVICRSIMYDSITPHGYFYRDGFIVFYEKVLSRVLQVNINMNIDDLKPYVTYFWNRQLVIQLTMVPKKVAIHNVTVPLDRSFKYIQLQADIMTLRQLEQTSAYQKTHKYVLVIIETFSRFIWITSLDSLSVDSTKKAINTALKRQGIAIQFYDFIREKVTSFIVDGGSEFKESFPKTIKDMFPNAIFTRSSPKNQTYGRPTITGPVEASIRMLRKCIRDYSMGIKQTFLQRATVTNDYDDGWRTILKTYNTHKQIITLQNRTPFEVVNGMINRNIFILTLNNHMLRQQQLQLDKKTESLLPIITTRNQGYAYRLWADRGFFPKEVDFHVNLPCYIITKFTYQTVDLIGFHFPDRYQLKGISWKQLVLVKVPIEEGPHQLVANLIPMATKNQYRIENDPQQNYQINNPIQQAVVGPQQNHHLPPPPPPP